MEIVILKNDKIIARATVEQDLHKNFAMKIFDTMPEYPTTPPEKGFEWELEYADGALTWVQKERPLTMEERLEAIEQKQYAWKPNEAVKVGDERYYTDGYWYKCLQAHTTQADWTPDIVPALWERMNKA